MLIETERSCVFTKVEYFFIVRLHFFFSTEVCTPTVCTLNLTRGRFGKLYIEAEENFAPPFSLGDEILTPSLSLTLFLSLPPYFLRCQILTNKAQFAVTKWIFLSKQIVPAIAIRTLQLSFNVKI